MIYSRRILFLKLSYIIQTLSQSTNIQILLEIKLEKLNEYYIITLIRILSELLNNKKTSVSKKKIVKS